MTLGPAHEGSQKRQQPSAEGSCSRLFRVFAGQEVNYFEHHKGGNPVSQLQSSDFTKGCFSSAFTRRVTLDGLPDGKTIRLSYHQLCLALLSTFLVSKVVGSQHLTSTGFSKLFCTFFSSETKLGLQLYPCSWQGKSLYTIGRILVFPH